MLVSVPDDLLSVGAEDVGGWLDLGRVDFDSWVFADLQQHDLLLDGEELVEVQTVLVG